MLFAFIFLLLFSATIVMWLSMRKASLILFAIASIAAISWFMHHATSTLGISL